MRSVYLPKMIRITQVSEDYFEVEHVQKGVHVAPKRLHRSELPASLSTSMIMTKLLTYSLAVDAHVGKIVAEGVWELDDICLQTYSRSETQD